MTWALAAWLSTMALAWLAVHAAAGGWARRWRLAPAGLPEGDVLVVIPARDEVACIGDAVRGALASRSVRLRVVVVDDDSHDGTRAEAEAAGAGDARLEVRRAAERPAGWAGKAWACVQGATQSSARWLVFLDADVVLHPDAVAACVARAERDGAALLSLFGSWRVETFWERLVIPAIGWAIRGSVDLDAVNTNGPVAFANGQVLVVRRADYEAWGGHGSVRDAVLDDVGLARTARAAGARMRLLWAPWAFRVRLYEGLRALVAGYSKNLYDGLGRRPVALGGAVLGLLAGSIAPAAAAPALWAAGRPALATLAVGVVGLAIAFRWRLERRDGRSGLVSVLHPLADVALVIVLLRSALVARTSWKGREFVRGRAS